MYIDDKLIDQIAQQAASSPRLRMHYDLRDSEEDSSQRILNVLQVGTIMNIHRHTNSSETVIVLRGHIIERLYNESNMVIAEFDLDPKNGNYGMQVPKNVLHNFEVLEPSAIISFKDGKFE